MRLRACIGLTYLCIAHAVAAQSFFQYGITAGYDFSVPLGLQRAAGSISYCNCDGTGTSLNHSALIGGFLSRRDYFSEAFGASARLGLGWSQGSFRSNQYVGESFFDPVGLQTITPLARFDVESEYLFGIVDLLGTLGLTEYVTLEAGPWLSLRLHSRFRQTESLLAPDGAVFPENGSRARTLREDGEIAGPPLSGGALVAFRFASPLPGDVDLMWDLHTRVDARALREKLSIRSFSIGAGLTIVFRSELAPDPPPRPETMPEYAPPPIAVNKAPKKLEATISLFSETPTGERVHYALVRTSQHYFRQKTPVIPAVYFERNSALIPLRYTQLAPASTAAFSTKSLIRQDAVSQHAHVLNVLGMRLVTHGDASVTLIGNSSPDEPMSIALARAEAVQLYLRNVWGIKPSRLKLETRPPRAMKAPSDAPALRGVEIASASRDMLEPVATDWMVEKFHSAPINLDPAIRNPGTLKDWTITISHKGREVARYSNADGGSGGDIDANLLLRGAGSEETDVPPLIAQISAADSTGTITTATDALSFRFTGDSLDDGHDVTYLSTMTDVFPGTDFTLSPEGSRNREMLREMAGLLSDGDSVTVSPVVDDRNGSLSSNRKMQSDVQHAASVLQLELGKKKVAISIGRGHPRPASTEHLPEYERLGSFVAITLHRNLGTARAAR
ncbi:MAG: hypothetical protein IPP94_15310 [Ignavibacteria bacterium]|nr:hypothetical protein [Ignavibacteria bacterium]